MQDAQPKIDGSTYNAPDQLGELGGRRSGGCVPHVASFTDIGRW